MCRNCLLIIVMAFMVSGSDSGDAQEPKLEQIEWSDVWVVNANTDEGPRVLLVGDSIVKGYYGVVEKGLSGRASCARYATSLFLSNPDYLAELTLMLNRYRFDVIHINNGLHGWDYTEEEYRQGVRELLAVMKRCAPESAIIWCATTPVRVAKDVARIDEGMNARVVERNRIAAEIMHQQAVPVNDLYAAVIAHPEYFSDDGVHFNGNGQAVLGEQVVAIIAEHLPERIKAFCIDFNWGPQGFATPGMYAQADAQQHFEWYRDMGVNTIQTFCVSCPGYAWYDSKVVPAQPGMKGEFLKELVALGHANDMRVMGYFCIGANTHWNEIHPELSHNFPSAISIPFTLAYMDYLDQVITEAVTTTGIDGFMIDWVYNASHLYPDREYRWLDCEKEMYAELFGEPFPGEDVMDAERINAFNKRATERCWDRIRNAAKTANPDCILWLTCYDLQHPMLEGSRMLKEVDWLMNEHPDPEKLAATRALVGGDTRIIQCICGWGDQHNAEKIINDKQYDDLGLYGFARPDMETTLPPDDDSGNARNIAAMRRAFTEK